MMTSIRFLSLTFSALSTLTCVVYGLMDYNNKSPIEVTDVKGHLGKSATLSCKLRTGRHNRGWFALLWGKMLHDGSTTQQLLRLTARDRIPTWDKDVQDSLKVRVTPLVTIQPGHVEFNIRFDNLTCEDQSEYKCSVITGQGDVPKVAELSIYAGPRPPNITEDLTRDRQHQHHHYHHQNKQHHHRRNFHHRHHGHNNNNNNNNNNENHHNSNPHHDLSRLSDSTSIHSDTSGSHDVTQDDDDDDDAIHVTCRGDVGLPPQMLVWYARKPGESFFEMIDKQRVSSEELDGCHVIRTRTLSIRVAEVPVGTRYRCGYVGYIQTQGMFDEYVIQDRHRVASGHAETVKDKRTEDLNCQQGNCQVGRSSRHDNGDDNDSDDNADNQGSAPNTTLKLLTITVLVAAWVVSPS